MHDFSMLFRHRFVDAFSDTTFSSFEPKMLDSGITWRPNGTPNRSTIGLGTQGPPKARLGASREPLGAHVGPVLELSGAHCRLILGPSGLRFERFGDHPWLLVSLAVLVPIFRRSWPSRDSQTSLARFCSEGAATSSGSGRTGVGGRGAA